MAHVESDYREIRVVLESLVAAWPRDYPGEVIERARRYLDFHCQFCGARLTWHDLLTVFDNERVRARAAEAPFVPHEPICITCYHTRHTPASLITPILCQPMATHQLSTPQGYNGAVRQPPRTWARWRAHRIDTCIRALHADRQRAGVTTLDGPPGTAAPSVPERGPPRGNTMWRILHTRTFVVALMLAGLLVMIALILQR